MSSIKRLRAALTFYREEVAREAHKERDILRGLRGAKPVVSYMGFTGHNNLGDEILYEAHQELFPHLTLVPFRASKLAEAAEKAKKKNIYRAGILGGGTLINQSGRWLEQMAYLRRRGLPVFCLGTGVMPEAFRPEGGKTDFDTWVKALQDFIFVGVRGPQSLSALRAAGLKKAIMTGDTALSLARPDFTPRPKGKVIGINYGLVKENRLWGDGDAYTEAMVEIIKQLIKRGYEVRLLPVWDKDLPSNRALVRAVNDPRCTLRVNFGDLAAYRRELADCSLFIGQKLHATIIACMERIPSIMVEYQPKCRDFMESVGMERYILRTSDCTPHALLGMLEELESNYPDIQQQLNERILHWRRLQHRLAAKIEQQLLAD